MLESPASDEHARDAVVHLSHPAELRFCGAAVCLACGSSGDGAAHDSWRYDGFDAHACTRLNTRRAASPPPLPAARPAALGVACLCLAHDASTLIKKY